MKACRLCGEVKPYQAFYAQVGMRDGYRNECKACFQAAAKAKRDADPELRAAAVRRAQKWRDENIARHNQTQRVRRQRPEVKQRDREGHLKRKYGMTLGEFDRLLEAQGGGCAICGRAPGEGRKFDVDHDHVTGRVRRILCRPCNHALGLFKEDPALLLAAADYLWEHTEVEEISAIRERALALSV
jgi:hypothetical protein